ncbi:hypothetical protein [Paraburkholderia caballeronis]|uniref:hypothetical protein n=1 Tax=Paraburkholderia caballeronis TaxID=416943 RepID=UPI00106691E1|nr:hypothetical protein [Paraburkholderia caballeronis]
MIAIAAIERACIRDCLREAFDQLTRPRLPVSVVAGPLLIEHHREPQFAIDELPERFSKRRNDFPLETLVFRFGQRARFTLHVACDQPGFRFEILDRLVAPRPARDTFELRAQRGRAIDGRTPLAGLTNPRSLGQPYAPEVDLLRIGRDATRVARTPRPMPYPFNYLGKNPSVR